MANPTGSHAADYRKRAFRTLEESMEVLEYEEDELQRALKRRDDAYHRYVRVSTHMKREGMLKRNVSPA